MYYNVLKMQNLFSQLWDTNAQVPYLVGNGALQTFVSFDNQESIGLKAAYIKEKNLRGAIIWEITGDYVETSIGSGIIEGTPLVDTLKSVFCNGIQTGVATEKTTSIAFFPNPASSQFTILLPIENAEITITDFFGHQILKTKATQRRMNLQLDNNGVYFVTVSTNLGTTTQKLIVNR
jgi:GH18 family chitinase